jgi:hypothetical protein
MQTSDEQTIRDWVLAYADGPEGLIDGKAPRYPSKFNSLQAKWQIYAESMAQRAPEQLVGAPARSPTHKSATRCGLRRA